MYPYVRFLPLRSRSAEGLYYAVSNSMGYSWSIADQLTAVSAGHPGKHMWVRHLLDLDVKDWVYLQMCSKCSSLWGALQACRKTRLPGGVHKGMHSYPQSLTLIPKIKINKVVGHMEDHMCTATLHTCGEVSWLLVIIGSISFVLIFLPQPCGLAGIILANGTVYSCTGTCCISRQVSQAFRSCNLLDSESAVTRITNTICVMLAFVPWLATFATVSAPTKITSTVWKSELCTFAGQQYSSISYAFLTH